MNLPLIVTLSLTFASLFLITETLFLTIATLYFKTVTNFLLFVMLSKNHFAS